MASVSPSNAVFQGRAGGWPGFPTFTDPTKAYIASPLTVNWQSGPLAYNFASGFPIPGQGLTPLTLFITLSDPTRSGTGTVFLDTDSNRWSQNGEAFANVGTLQVYNITPSVPAGGAAAPSAVLFAQTTLSAAQLLNLNNVAVAVTPTPPAGSFILPVTLSYEFAPGSAVYVLQAGDKLGITPNVNDSAALLWSVPCAGFLDAPANAAKRFLHNIPFGSSSGGLYGITHIDGAPLLLTYVSFQNPTTGNGILTVNVLYAVIAEV